MSVYQQYFYASKWNCRYCKDRLHAGPSCIMLPAMLRNDKYMWLVLNLFYWISTLLYILNADYGCITIHNGRRANDSKRATVWQTTLCSSASQLYCWLQYFFREEHCGLRQGLWENSVGSGGIVCVCASVCMSPYVYVYVCMYVCMYVCICMYACMYVCIYVCVCMYLYVRMYVCMYTYVYVCMYVRMYVCMYICVCMYVFICTYVSMYACMYVRMYVCVCMYACIYVRTCVCMYVCTYVYIYIYIYICTYICMYICTCVCMYVSMYACRSIYLEDSNNNDQMSYNNFRGSGKRMEMKRKSN